MSNERRMPGPPEGPIVEWIGFLLKLLLVPMIGWLVTVETRIQGLDARSNNNTRMVQGLVSVQEQLAEHNAQLAHPSMMQMFLDNQAESRRVFERLEEKLDRIIERELSRSQ